MNDKVLDSLEPIADHDDAFDPCQCQGLLLGMLLGSLGWALIFLVWWLV